MNNNFKQIGKHLIIELDGVEFNKLNSVNEIKTCLENSAKEAKATILYSYMHEFQPQGVTGVIVLAESHISIHTFPELGYAAIDVFMCYNMEPEKCLKLILDYFNPTNYQLNKLTRGY